MPIFTQPPAPPDRASVDGSLEVNNPIRDSIGSTGSSGSTTSPNTSRARSRNDTNRDALQSALESVLLSCTCTCGGWDNSQAHETTSAEGTTKGDEREQAMMDLDSHKKSVSSLSRRLDTFSGMVRISAATAGGSSSSTTATTTTSTSTTTPSTPASFSINSPTYEDLYLDGVRHSSTCALYLATFLVEPQDALSLLKRLQARHRQRSLSLKQDEEGKAQFLDSPQERQLQRRKMKQRQQQQQRRSRESPRAARSNSGSSSICGGRPWNRRHSGYTSETVVDDDDEKVEGHNGMLRSRIDSLERAFSDDAEEEADGWSCAGDDDEYYYDDPEDYGGLVEVDEDEEDEEEVDDGLDYFVNEFGRKVKKASLGLSQPKVDAFAPVRVLPSGTFHLFAGSKFRGKQKSGSKSYDVLVDIKHVSLEDSSLCGYLHISGLTEEYPELTTYFDAEIVGPDYSFVTRKWDADIQTDRDHWSLFKPFESMRDSFTDEKFKYDFKDNQEVMFMRWKEHFLVPDHRVEGISGASFAGFYYICYDKLKGEMDGYYYHRSSEKYQKLTLKHVQDRAPSFGSFELA